jgi:hypothetical protein
MSKPSGHTIPWCTGHYTRSFCNEKAAELRASGRYSRVWLSDPRTESGQRDDGSYGPITYHLIMVEYTQAEFDRFHAPRGD